MTAAWRGLALVALTACLIVCRQAGGGQPSSAAPSKDAPAAEASLVKNSSHTAAVAAADAGATKEPASRPAPALKPAACAQLRQHVEQQLAAAQRCKASDECVVEELVDYVFRPCGLSVRKGAPLDKARADAKRYKDRCRPVIHPARCANLTRPVCERGRCVLAPPEPK